MKRQKVYIAISAEFLFSHTLCSVSVLLGGDSQFHCRVDSVLGESYGENAGKAGFLRLCRLEDVPAQRF
jgi:hypothetical protein